MTPWIVFGVIYILGGAGMYMTACDLNGGPIKTKWKRAMFLIWPAVVIIQGLGDVFDALDGDRPNWLGR